MPSTRTFLILEMKCRQMRDLVQFGFVTDTAVRRVLVVCYADATRAFEAASYLDAVVGYGAVAEGLLTWGLAKHNTSTKAMKSAKKCRQQAIANWKLSVLINVANGLALLNDQQAQTCRAIADYRNLVNPQQEPGFRH